MIDSKRKGRNIYCVKCRKKTRHILLGKDEVQISKDDFGKTIVTKLVWLICKVCGTSKLIDRW